MKTELTEVNKCVRELDVEVGWDELKNEFGALIDKYHLNYQRKGFRKGKYPNALFKKEMVPSIEVEFSDKAVNDYFTKALEEHQLYPVNQAKIDHFHFHENDELHFKAVFEVIPEFTLPDYQHHLSVTVDRLQNTEKDTRETLERIRSQYAESHVVDRPAEKSDLILADIQETDSEGHPLPVKIHEDQLIDINRGIFDENDRLVFIGKSAGDTVTISNHSQTPPVHFNMVIKEVKSQVFPELNDEFAAKVKPGITTLEELKHSIETELQQELDRRFEHNCRDRIADHFVKNTSMDVPSSMKERYLDSIVEDVKRKTPPAETVDEAQVRDSYSMVAENAIRWQLIMDKLIEVENLTVGPEDLNRKYEAFSAQYNTPVEKIKAMYANPDRLSKLRDDILNDKLFDHLKSFATINEVLLTTDDIKNPPKK